MKPLRETKTNHNPNCPHIGGSGSGKLNALLNLISHQPDIINICLHVKDPYKPKYQLLINKR